MSLISRIRHLLHPPANENRWVPEQLYSDDVFIVSYPKSGNTWVRFLIGNYLTGNECTFANNHLITPDIHMNPERCAEVNRPRFIKSHSPYQPKYPNVIYVVRDGRDVAVSYFHYSLKMRNIDQDVGFSEFLEMFNKGEIDPFGRWSDHIHGWIDHRNDSVLIVRYEDLLDDTARELRRMIEFCNIKTQESAIHEAVQASSFERMQRLREEQQDIIQSIRESDSKKKFLRSGKKGEWEDYIDSNQEDKFLDIHGDALQRVGYTI
jgi:hypothetical protein